MPQPRLEVADIFRRHGEAWRAANAGHVSPAQRRVMTAIEICRTTKPQPAAAAPPSRPVQVGLRQSSPESTLPRARA